MKDYLAAIWRSRYFWLSLVKMDLRTRYRRSVLGLGWSLLHPIVMTVIYCSIFPMIFHVDMHTYVPFLFIGLVFWNYMVSVTVNGCQCMFAAEPYIRQYPSPLAIYPLRASLGGTVHFLCALIVVLPLQLILNGIAHPLAMLSIIPTLALFFVMVWSLATLAAFSHVYFPDTQHLIEDGFQVMFFATPIIYGMSILQTSHLARFLVLNPFVYLLRLLRDPILEGHSASLACFAVSGGFVMVLFVLAATTLARLQKTLIFHL